MADFNNSPDNNDESPHQSRLEENKLKEAQAQVDDVLDIMRDNVQKTMERENKLSELDERADALQQNAQQFGDKALKLKRKHWWQNTKMMIIIGILGCILLISIILLIAL